MDLTDILWCPLGSRSNWNFPGQFPRLDWVIVGGESGPGARPCNVQGIRDVVDQCRAAGVPCFVKQLGAKPMDPKWETWKRQRGPAIALHNKKGGDWNEWPEDLRVREYPQATDANVQATHSRGVSES